MNPFLVMVSKVERLKKKKKATHYLYPDPRSSNFPFERIGRDKFSL